MALTNGLYKGKGLVFTITGTDYTADTTNWGLASDDKDIVTFADLTAGNRQWNLTVNTVMDLATGSLYRYVWDNAGTTGVAVLAKIYGNSTASATKPHVSFTVNIPNKPDLSGDAGSNWTTDITFEVSNQPTLVTT
jgi:hypothetical protein